MSSILENWRGHQFEVPTSPREYMALQIARKLEDLSRARDYAILLEHFPENLILRAFRQARSIGQITRDSFLAAFRSILAAPIEHDEYDDETAGD